MMNIGIVGLGHVGEAMRKLFTAPYLYDEPKKIGDKEMINQCDVVFVCVPTPQRESGECDTSIVDKVLEWLQCETIVLRSTVPVGYTDQKVKELHKQIVFQPEYYGETVNHPFADLRERRWITLGGTGEAVRSVVNAYQNVYTSNVVINIVDAKTAEMAKYMENCFLAAKVIFCNEFYDLALAYGIDYTQLRETWLLDPRMGRSHTFVYPQNRGFSGSCLPKDLAALICQAKSCGVDVSILDAVQAKNAFYHAGNKE